MRTSASCRQRRRRASSKPSPPTQIVRGRAVPMYEHASVLHPEYVMRATISQDGSQATGVVTFAAPDAFDGHVRYFAVRGAGGWRIERFPLPQHGALDSLAPPTGDGRCPTAMAPRRAPCASPAAAARRSICPRSPSRGATPQDALVIRVDGEGWLSYRGERVGLSALGAHLSRDALVQRYIRPENATSSRPILLEVDRSVHVGGDPVAVDDLRGARARRPALPRREERRTGRRDRPSAAEPARRPRSYDQCRRVREDEAQDLHARDPPCRWHRPSKRCMRPCAGSGPRSGSEYHFLELVTPPPSGPAASSGFVAQVLAVAYISGFQSCLFEASPMPEGLRPNGGVDSTAEDFRAAVRAPEAAAPRQRPPGQAGQRARQRSARVRERRLCRPSASSPDRSASISTASPPGLVGGRAGRAPRRRGHRGGDRGRGHRGRGDGRVRGVLRRDR